MATRFPVSGVMSMSPSRSSSMAVRLGPSPEQRQRLRELTLLQRFAIARPAFRRLMREPGVLPFRVATRSLLPGRHCLLSSDVTAQPGRNLPDADRPHHWERGIEPSMEQRPNLIRGTQFDHVAEPRIASPIKPIAWWEQDQRFQVDRLVNPALALLLPLDECPTGRQDDLERPGDARGIG